MTGGRRRTWRGPGSGSAATRHPTSDTRSASREFWWWVRAVVFYRGNSLSSLASDKLQYGLKVGILMKMSSLLKELPNTLIIIASLVKRFPSLREARPINQNPSSIPIYCPGNNILCQKMDKNQFKCPQSKKYRYWFPQFPKVRSICDISGIWWCPACLDVLIPHNLFWNIQLLSPLSTLQQIQKLKEDKFCDKRLCRYSIRKFFVVNDCWHWLLCFI